MAFEKREELVAKNDFDLLVSLGGVPSLTLLRSKERY